ncbi:MAG: cyclomaltodextrinase N-terminal domain-containing protein, partial [Duncaniella sp.]|nr:cyclomaltodextrinase N-terminal domain-containing protein [Duncaniella sp.]
MAIPHVDKIEPPFWWTGMENDTVQLMIYGTDIAVATPSISYQGVKIADVVVPDSRNYLFIYLTIAPETRPGTMKIDFSYG